MMLLSDLYKKDNYLTNLSYLKNTTIIEYDLSKANINILKVAGVIDDDRYNYLYRLPKQDRERFVGQMIIPDSSIYNVIKSGVIEAKRKLFLNNDIKSEEVVRIANDAVFVARGNPLSYTKFGLLEFKIKHKYSIFINLCGILIFFNTDMGMIDMDVVNLGKEQLSYHADYMISFIGNLLYLVSTSDIQTVMNYFNGFYTLYLNRALEPNYYREFNSESLFRIDISNDRKLMGFGMTSVTPENLNKLDISYNAYVLRELYSVIVNMMRY